MLYRMDNYARGIVPTREQREAIEAGKKYVQAAYPDVWARNGELVQRVRRFLGANFHWHDRLLRSASDLEVVNTLFAMVRGDSIAVIAEEPRYRSGGFVDSGRRSVSPAVGYSVMEPWIADRMREFARSLLPAGEPILSGPYRPDREASGQLAAARAALADSGKATVLGSAAPFEYAPDFPGGEAFDLAASTRNPKFAAKMLGRI
jgi:hypothetical protein